MKFDKYLNDVNPQVELEVKDLGTIKIELFPKVAPITCQNFLNLVESGFYTNLIFHRVINGFMIQGGDPTGTGCGGSKETIKGEFNANGVRNVLEHTRGVISMARTSDPNSASSQFFIMHQNASHLDGMYAAFGAVISGMEVVDKIATTDTDYEDRPLVDVVIKEARRLR